MTSILAGPFGITATPPLPQEVRWRYHFTDHKSGRLLATLPLEGAEFTEILSGVGEGGGTVPLASAEIRSRDPWGSTVPRKTVCWAERQVMDEHTGRVAFSTYPFAGPVLTRKRSRVGRTLALSMVSWAGWWNARLITADLAYTAVDDFTIVRNVFAQPLGAANGSCASVDVAGAGNLAGTTSDATWAAIDSKIALEAATQFAAANRVEWRWRYSRSGAGVFTARLELGRPLGRDQAHAPDLVWSSDDNVTRAGQLIDYEVTEDGSGVRNHLIALGAGSGPEQIRSDVTAASVGRDEFAYGYPVWEGSLNSSTSDLKTQVAVDRNAQAAMRAGLAGELLVSGIQVRGDLAPTLDTYEAGDTVTLRLADVYSTDSQLSLPARLLGRKLTPAQAGTSSERVAFTVQPLPNF